MSVKLLENPTLDEVNNTLAKLAVSANNNFRVRTASLELTKTQWASASGRFRAGGEVPGAAYATFSKMPTTTVVGILWASTGDDYRVVVATAIRRVVTPGALTRIPFQFYQSDWNRWTPYHLTCEAVSDAISARVNRYVPSTHDGSLLPGIDIQGVRSLLQLIETGPPIVLPSPPEDVAELVRWLKARIALYSARHHPANVIPGPRSVTPPSRPRLRQK
jgi:hypothetical protein